MSNIQMIDVLFKQSKAISQDAIEDYLKRTGWVKDTTQLWRHSEDHHRPAIYVNPDILGRCIDTLAETEKRPSGAIWKDIMEPSHDRNN